MRALSRTQRRRGHAGRSAATNYARGLLMGGADVIPGVSGGTVALIVGIYERLISSVRAAASAPVALLRGDRIGARRRVGEVDWGLVLPLGAGILSALLVGASVIPGLLHRYPAQMSALFFGLIAGSLAIPWRRIDAPGVGKVALASAFAVVAFVLVGLPPRAVPDPSLPQVFLSAALAICAMILPGVSGAFLLLVLGIYERTLEALSGGELVYVLVFVAGCAIGLGLFSRVLEWLLERHHERTMAALVGLMAGSLRALWPWLDADRGMRAPPLDASLLAVLGLAAAGFVAVGLLTRFGESTADDDLTVGA